MIEKYLNSVICGDLDDIEIRKSIIKTFVREIVLTNDKITIAFNFIDHSSTKGRLKDDMQEIEKQAQKPAFTIPLSSYKLASLPPKFARRLSSAGIFFVIWNNVPLLHFDRHIF